MFINAAEQFEAPPQKIISLVPSQTELLHWLGLDNEVIGITKFCVHPKKWHREKTRVGGTKNVNIKMIKMLQPDLIIANKEENDKDQIEALGGDFNVWLTEVKNLEDALQMINDVGKLTGKSGGAIKLITRIQAGFSHLAMPNHPFRSCYLIWQKPYITVGGDTFISDMMKRCSLQNIYDGITRYPEITLKQISSDNCQLILLSSEPFPFKQKHADELQQLLPEKKIILVDGEMFSWYGSRLLAAPAYFKWLMEQVIESS